MLFYFTSYDEEVEEIDKEAGEEAETEVTEKKDEDSKDGEELEVPTEGNLGKTEHWKNT